MRILVVAGFAPIFPADAPFDRIVGVDRGALKAAEEGLTLDLALGDFDSLTAAEFRLVADVAGEVVQLAPEKDATDLEVALAKTLADFPSADLTLTGALGGRLDHALTNLLLPTTEKFRKFSPKLTLIDAQNTVSYLLPGTHTLVSADKKYIGFWQLANTRTLSITGAKYPLKVADNWADIYASNEFVSASAPMTVSFTEGVLVVIRSDDPHRKDL
ncbi:MAG: thiamine diphosphokinase [Streptococcaceae bacterium]|jgi:thiamine pyrophosphokinase|nr:thiamine diphosphokinase [Streptococcaceae bacterium]